MEKGRHTCRDTRRDVEVNALVKTLADRLAVVKAKTVSDALGHVEAASHVNKLAATLEKIGAKIIGDRMRDVEGEALVDRTLSTHWVMCRPTTGGHAGSHGNRVGGQHTWRHILPCAAPGTGRNTN